jgi:hypothetical protein
VCGMLGGVTTEPAEPGIAPFLVVVLSCVVALGQVTAIGALALGWFVPLGSGFDADGSVSEPPALHVATHVGVLGDVWPYCLVLVLAIVTVIAAIDRRGDPRLGRVLGAATITIGVAQLALLVVPLR